MGCGGEAKELSKTKIPNTNNNVNNITNNNTPKINNIPNNNNAFKNNPQININNNNMNNINRTQNPNNFPNFPNMNNGFDQQKFNEYMKNIQDMTNNMTNNAMNMGGQGRVVNNIVNNYNTKNKGGEIDTTNFNENDYPIFESNWTDTNLLNIRFVTLGVVNKVILNEKLFITINLDKRTAKVVKIYKEEFGSNKKKRLIQKIHTDVSSLEDLVDDIEEYTKDYDFMHYDMTGEFNGKDAYLAAQNINNHIKYKFIYYDKENDYATYSDSEGEKGGEHTGGLTSMDRDPEEVVKDFNKLISEIVDIKNQNIKYVDKDKDIDKDNFEDFYPKPFQSFWQKKFYQNFAIETRLFDENKREEIRLELYITIDKFNNKTKFVKKETILNEEGKKDHAIQKIYRQKKTMEQFKSEMEYLDKNFHIFVPGMFSPPKDIFIIALNDNGVINRCMSIFDKETNNYEMNSIEGQNGNFNTNKTIDNKRFTEIYKYYYEKFDSILYPDSGGEEGEEGCFGDEGEEGEEAYGDEGN
jgi:hypothetical protein